MAIADLLAKLVELKSQLVTNLSSMGVTADESEKLNTLVPKVLECKTKQNVEFVEGLSNDFTLATACKSVIIPVSVTSIGANAFNGCTNLASITIPDGVTSIEVNAFNGCTNLASITIPDGVTGIGDFSFSKCSSLSSIIIPDSVTSIGNYAFKECSSLASITIPVSVTRIGVKAFNECTNLANIYYKGTKEQWNAITKDTNWNLNMGSNVEGGTVITYNYTG